MGGIASIYFNSVNILTVSLLFGIYTTPYTEMAFYK